MNPFERDDFGYVVLRNAYGQYSMWPSTLMTPRGWVLTESAGTRASCLAWLDANWTDMTPHVFDNSGIAADCVGTAFERQVAATPRAVALQCGPDALTFEELNCRANQIAHRLSRQGVAPETLSVIWLPRNADAVVAILGILKAGGGYVVPDQSNPNERLVALFDEARPKVIITNAALHGRLPPLTIPVLRLDADTALLKRENSENPRPTCQPSNVAYVTFTSGTSGRPKGVIVTHETILNELSRVPFKVGDPEEVCALTAPLSFGMSVAQLFLPLLSGVRVAIVGEDATQDTRRLIDSLEQARVTVVTLVPSHLRELLRQGETVGARLARLRTAITGGAQVNEDVVRAFAVAFPKAQLLNGYAASETGAITTLTDRTGTSAVPSGQLGSSFPNVRVYVLDERMDKARANSPGEIYVGSAHLARGYLGMPGVTAERFVADPFASGGRLYRTGDLGQYGAAGSIQFLARVDDEVKIRGFRVSLREVEDALQDQPGVRHAAASVQQIGDEQRLVGYVVPDTVAPVVSELRARLRQSLPEYMVPTAFVSLPRLPMTSTGKVDRRSLPSVDLVRPILNDMYAPPRTLVEALLVRIWVDVLKIDRVGINDDFVELGGDSLTAMQVLTRVEEELGVQVSFAAFFEHSTVESFVRSCLSDVECVEALSLSLTAIRNPNAT